MKTRDLAVVFGTAAVVATAIYIALPKEVHEHANFLVYLGGEQINFSQERFMSEETICQIEGKPASELTIEEKAHLHDLVGWVAHVHAPGISWGFFFRNLDIQLNSSCFVFEGNSYCSNETHELRMFVNGRQATAIGDTLVHDLDRVLITHGPSGEDISNQIASVPDDACIFSDKCPERGRPEAEEC